jgi:hypothetical protein
MIRWFVLAVVLLLPSLASATNYWSTSFTPDFCARVPGLVDSAVPGLTSYHNVPVVQMPQTSTNQRYAGPYLICPLNYPGNLGGGIHSIYVTIWWHAGTSDASKHVRFQTDFQVFAWGGPYGLVAYPQGMANDVEAESAVQSPSNQPVSLNQTLTAQQPDLISMDSGGNLGFSSCTGITCDKQPGLLRIQRIVNSQDYPNYITIDSITVWAALP